MHTVFSINKPMVDEILVTFFKIENKLKNFEKNKSWMLHLGVSGNISCPSEN